MMLTVAYDGFLRNPTPMLFELVVCPLFYYTLGQVRRNVGLPLARVPASALASTLAPQFVKKIIFGAKTQLCEAPIYAH